MKKIFLILLTFSLLFTVSCADYDKEKPSDNSSEKETLEHTPLEIKLTAYEPVVVEITNATFSSDSKWRGGLTSVSIDDFYEETDIEPTTITLNDVEQTLTYYHTYENVGIYREIDSRNAKTRTYLQSSESETSTISNVSIDVNTGKIVGLEAIINRSEQPDTIFSKEECREIGTSFIKNIDPSVDLGSYSCSELDLTDSYIFTYTKHVDGYKTFDYIKVGVTTYGSVVDYYVGDNIDENEIARLNVNYDLAYNAVENIAKNADSYEITISSPVYHKLSNGVYGLYYSVFIGNMEKSGGIINVFVPLQNG